MLSRLRVAPRSTALPFRSSSRAFVRLYSTPSDSEPPTQTPSAPDGTRAAYSNNHGGGSTRPYPEKPALVIGGQHVIINGAGHLGSALAGMFARMGCNVTVMGRSEERLKLLLGKVNHLSTARKAHIAKQRVRPTQRELAQEKAAADYAARRGWQDSDAQTPDTGLPEESGSEVDSQEISSSSADPVAGNRYLFYRTFEQLSEILSRERYIDVLINCGGIDQRELHMKMPFQQVRTITAVNLDNTMVACQAASKGLIRAGKDSVVVNVSSILGVQGGRGAAAYAATKAGIIGFTRAFASEMGPLGVRVNCIVPGYIGGGGMANSTHTASQPMVETKHIPLGRYGTVDEMAHAIKFLVVNKYATNCVLNLDGGLSAVLGFDTV